VSRCVDLQLTDIITLLSEMSSLINKVSTVYAEF